MSTLRNYNPPKTHYEVALDFFKKVGVNTDTIFKQIEDECGLDPDYRLFVEKCLNKDIIPVKGDDRYKTAIFFNIFYHLYHTYVSHEKIYHVVPEMALKLSNTEINIDSYFLKSPFREIYLQIDPGLFHIRDNDGTHSISGIYVNFKEQKNNIKEIRVMAAALLEDTKQIPFNDALFYFRIFLGPGKIKDNLREYIKKEIGTRTHEIEKSGGLQNIDHIEELFNFVINLILYVTSKNPDILNQLPKDYSAEISRKKNKAKIRKLKNKMQASTSLPYILVGNKYRNNHQEVKQAHEAGGARSWRLNQRVYVSGYWRTQWYGSEAQGNRRSEIIFIEPYIKGPEFAEIVHKKYKVV